MVTMLLVGGALVAQQVCNADEARLASLVEKNCVKCHDGDVAFDLHKSPATIDAATWSKVLIAVETSRMPPAKQSGTVAERFPMDPADRTELVEAVSAQLGPDLQLEKRPLHMKYAVWARLVRDFAHVALSDDEIKPLLPGPHAWTRDDLVLPAYLVELQQESLAVCRAIAKADGGKPTAGRKIVPQLPWPTAAAGPWKATAIKRLSTSVFGDPSTTAQARDDAQLLDDAHRISNSWSEAWAALCTTYLSGPRLMYLHANLGSEGR